ncbi:MAG: helix-turn-helix transcriptional regulator [Phycisphaerae bacterium]|nr:helix-turn-helix transcriptional regulator [Phycisphaerae bacterium]
MGPVIDKFERSVGPKTERHSVEMFAELLKWQKAYDSASPEIRDIVDTMVHIINDPTADEEERLAAIDTLEEALFPTFTNGEYGIPLDDTFADNKGIPLIDEAARRNEKIFARKVKAAMKRRGMTQAQLAKKIGIGQSAVAMLLSRTCRPQKATVGRIAKALDLDPNDLWPE